MKNIEIAINAALYAGNEILEIYNSKDFEIQIKADKSPVTTADLAANKKIIEFLTETEVPIVSEENEISEYKIRKEIKNYWLIDPLDGTKEFINRNGEFTVNIALMEDNTPIAGVIYVPVLKELYFSHLDFGAFKVENIKAGNNKQFKLENLIKEAIELPIKEERDNLVVLSSKSHKTPENETFITKLSQKYPKIDTISKGSSLKICVLAEGKADIYPRFGPTSEWDTAAGHAILKAVGGNIMNTTTLKEIEYNKENILNPSFFAVRDLDYLNDV